MVRAGGQFLHIDIKSKKIIYVTRKRNESNIFDNFNEGGY